MANKNMKRQILRVLNIHFVHNTTIQHLQDVLRHCVEDVEQGLQLEAFQVYRLERRWLKVVASGEAEMRLWCCRLLRPWTCERCVQDLPATLGNGRDAHRNSNVTARHRLRVSISNTPYTFCVTLGLVIYSHIVHLSYFLADPLGTRPSSDKFMTEESQQVHPCQETKTQD